MDSIVEVIALFHFRLDSGESIYVGTGISRDGLLLRGVASFQKSV